MYLCTHQKKEQKILCIHTHLNNYHSIERIFSIKGIKLHNDKNSIEYHCKINTQYILTIIYLYV